MKTVKKTAEYTILQRRDNRYAVRGADNKWINGEAKVEILTKEGLVKEPPRKAAPEPEAESEETSPEGDAEA
jgi:hypothetical protein